MVQFHKLIKEYLFMNKTIATSLTTLLFVVVGISGVMMYFHLFSGQVKDLHEILGLIFFMAVITHVFYNFKSMKNYFTKKVFITIAIATLVVTNTFILQSLEKGDNPKGLIIESILKAPLNETYRILSIGNPKEKLTKENFHITDASSLEELAKLNNTNPFKIISILTKD